MSMLCLPLLLLLLRSAWPAAGKRPKCMLFRLNCRFSQTSPATVCHVCGSYITAIYAANGMLHSGTDTCMYVCMCVLTLNC